MVDDTIREEESLKMRDEKSGEFDLMLDFRGNLKFRFQHSDQVITEGQDFVISAKVRGQPKPMVSW